MPFRTKQKRVKIRVKKKKPRAPLPPNASTKIIDERIGIAMSRERASLDIGEAGAKMVEGITNPKSDETGIPIYYRIPAGGARTTAVIRESWDTTFSTGTHTSCIVSLCGPCVSGATEDPGLLVVYGGDMSAATTTPSAVGEYAAQQGADFGNLFLSTRLGRITSAFVRIQRVADDDRSGNFKGVQQSRLLLSAAATPSNLGAWYNGLTRRDTKTYTAQQGITVRWNPEANCANFEKPNVYNYQSTQTDTLTNNWTCMPAIICTELTPSVYWKVTAAVFAEVSVSADSTPIPVALPEFETELNGIIAYCNRLPFTAESESFKSFLKRVWGVGTKVVKFALANKGAITTIANSARTLAGI
jgi:hypothetical protein